jgi:hypothetical protein
MGRQVRLYLHPEDHPLVESFIRDELDCTLVAWRWESTVPVEIESSPSEHFEAFICPRPLLASVNPRYIETQGYWVVDATRDQGHGKVRVTGRLRKVVGVVVLRWRA